MITLATLSNLNEAFLLRSMLEASEIPAFIPDENTCQVDWGYINALGGVRVQIPEEFASEAASVLNDFKKGSAGEVVDPVGIQRDFSEAVTEEAGSGTSIPETPPSGSVWGPLALIFFFVLVIGGAAIVVQRAEAGANAIREGNAAYNQGDYNLCVTEYSRALASGKKDVHVYVRRGLAYKHLGKYDEAIADYTQALRLDPQDPYALINRGNAYSHKGELHLPLRI